MGHAHFQKDPQKTYKIPTYGAVIMGLTVLFFFAVSDMISYTFGRLIPALLMVESPEAIVFEPITTSDPDAPLDNNNNKAVEPELLLMKQQPITASFRTTIKHLQSKGGFRARFRGFSVFVVYSIIVQWVSQTISIWIPFLFFVAPIIASVLCAQLSLAWTHIVISDPSPKPWFRRVPSIKTWKKVAGPTAILAVAEQLAIVLPAYLAATSGFVGSPDDFANTTHAQRNIMVLKGFGVLVLSIALSLLVVIPANVTLTRVQASLLPDEVESIVPFDRSFGGKVIPEIVGGSGVIGILDAWKTFDWNSRVRLIKAYAKVMAMQFVLSILFFVVMGTQIALIIGKDLKKIFPGDGKDGDAVVFN